MININFAEKASPLEAMTDKEVEAHILGVIMVEHYSIKKGIDLFGDCAETAVTKELKKINDMNTYKPKHVQDLTNKERKEALASLLFITEKRDDTIKARLVGDGSKQRTYDGYNKSKGSSPTRAMDSFFLTGVIDARERRAVAMLDIENAFLHAENDEKVLMLLRGRLAELMVKVDPSLYRKYVTTSKKGVPMLYVKLIKALYRLLSSALLFYVPLAF